MAWIMRHRQTKGPDTDRPDLNNRATSRLYSLSQRPDVCKKNTRPVRLAIDGVASPLIG